MDLLYRAYSNPLDLMNLYINQGRFGQFVTGFLEEEYERRKSEAEKDFEWKLWTMYIHSYSDQPFGKWKESVTSTSASKANRDDELTDEGIQSIVNKLFPS